MSSQEKPYLLLINQTPESTEAQQLLVGSKLGPLVKVRLRDAGKYRFPRLITAEGTYIGLPRIRIFVKTQFERSE